MLSDLENKAVFLDFGQYIIYSNHNDFSESFLCLLPKSNCSIRGDCTELKLKDIVYFSKKTSLDELQLEYKAITEFLIKSDGIFNEPDYFNYLKSIQEKLLVSKQHSKRASLQAITYAELNDFVGVREMIEEGADVNYTKNLVGPFKGYSILDFAIHHGNDDMVATLLTIGATKTSLDGWSKSYIVRKDTGTIIEKILNNGNVLEHNLDEMLVSAYQNRDYDVIEKMINIQDKVFGDEICQKMLSHMIHINNRPITKRLLELGNLPTVKDICFAIKEGMMGFVSVLLNEIEFPIGDNRDMMMAAAASVRGAEMISILLKNGQYGTSLTHKGKSAVSVSAYLGRPDAFKILSKQFTDDLNLEDENGFTPLTLAIKRNYPEMIKEIMLLNPDLNYVNLRGETPLYIAAINSTKEVMLMLLGAGADPNHKNDKGTTPLMALALTKEIEAINTLLQKGGDPAIKNNNGLDTLTAAIVQKYDVPSIVELILSFGCDVNDKVAINNNTMSVKDLAERKEKYQSLIIMNKDKFNKSE